MLRIEFNNGVTTQATFSLVREGIVKLVGDSVNNLSGFNAFGPTGFLGDYSAYTTKYNLYTEIENGIMLSTGEVEPEPIIPEPIVPIEEIPLEPVVLTPEEEIESMSIEARVEQLEGCIVELSEVVYAE